MMIAMLESCEKVLDALKLLLTDPSTYNPYCIGTSENFWKRIKTEGLSPIVCSSSGVCTDTTYEDTGHKRMNRVWIGRAGNKMCSTFARRAVKKSSGNPLNITFNAYLNQQNMKPSKDYLDNDGFSPINPDLADSPQAQMKMNEAKSICSPEEITKMLESLPDWSKSLIARKSANYQSLIAINPISIENLYDSEPITEQWND